MEYFKGRHSTAQPSQQDSFSVSGSCPSPSIAPTVTDDDIEAIIQMATSTRLSSDGRPGQPRDTRTQLFVGNVHFLIHFPSLMLIMTTN